LAGRFEQDGYGWKKILFIHGQTFMFKSIHVLRPLQDRWSGAGDSTSRIEDIVRMKILRQHEESSH